MPLRSRPEQRAHRRPRRSAVRHPQVDWSTVDDVIYGCANQAGEDERNATHMSAGRVAGNVPSTTLNRLCGSGLDDIGTAPGRFAAAKPG